MKWLPAFVFALFFLSSATAQDNAAARYEINAKRIGVNPTDKDALPRSREFIRLDSTYYVGWMYEGMYKYDRSGDFLGFKNATVPLRKALVLLNKDYGSTLRNINSSIAFFSENIKLFQDYFMIVNALKESYDNIEMPDSVMALLDDVEQYHFQRDFFGLYEQRAWEYHRNRFFTSDKYSFLKNSVAENEQQAFQICYQGFGFIEKNKALNDAWFGASQSIQDRLRIYHYLALLHCYNKNYDSSEYYYQQLAQGGMVSWNNYGGMQSEIGNFATAKEYFKRDEFGLGHGFLNEPFYYLPILHVYSGNPKEAIQMSRDIIAQNGSTPGFGWYNIALGRGYLYDGQLDSAAFALNKAANFKELHIGTTLTQTQYDFTINLLKVQLLDKSISQVKFLNRGWWYSITALYKIASLKLQKLMQEYVVVNQLAADPDRVRLVYDLFCAESTTTFDEAWYLLKNFSPKYFIKKYQTYQQTDKRENIKRYFKLFESQFKWVNGDKEEARQDWDWMIKTTTLDTANEKLFLGRLYEDAGAAYKKVSETEYNGYCNLLMSVYPQLIPYSGLSVPMRLSVSGDDTEVSQQVIHDLKDCNIQFTENNSFTPLATISFTQKGDKYLATINVKSESGKPIVTNEKLIFKKPEGVGGEIGLRLFGKGGNIVFEAPQEDNER
ncbi:MAG: hypothetical protein M3R72_10900 [Bacteroidota bacterium]|nr:hypothetical protein [Bacteroidota bacterium]